MYEKDGEKYFVVDSHMHYWDASPANWVKGRGELRRGLDRVLPGLPGPRAAGDAPDARSTSRKVSEDDLMKDVFEDGYVDMAIFQPTYLKEWYTRRVQHHRAQRRAGREAPGQVHREHPVRPA